MFKYLFNFSFHYALFFVINSLMLGCIYKKAKYSFQSDDILS